MMHQIVVLLLIVSQAGLAGRVVDVYDGDTLYVDIADCPPVICHRLGVRLRGIDTPELRGARCEAERAMAIAARDLLRELVDGEDVVLLDPERGRYFRLVATVILRDGTDVGERIVAAGLARRYDGGARLPWCGAP